MRTQDLIQNLTKEHSVVKFETIRSYFLRWSSFTILLLGITLWLLPARFDYHYYSTSFSFWLQNVLWLALAWILAAYVFYSSIPGARTFIYKALSFLLLGSVIASQSTYFPIPVMEDLRLELDLWRGRCGLIILAMTLVHSIFSYVMVKRLAPVKPKLTGFLIPLASGVLGCLTMQFICFHTNSVHIYLWHYLPVISTAFVGFSSAHFLLRWK